ncbi:MAG: hypothetical protein V3U78_06300 [Thiotrichaceae bacterium]
MPDGVPYPAYKKFMQSPVSGVLISSIEQPLGVDDYDGRDITISI